MNRTPEEKLFDHLSNVDADLFSEAMDIDSAAKLQKNHKIIPFTQKTIFRMAVAAAACLAIVAGILPMFNREAPLPGDAQLDTPPNFIEPNWGTRPSDPTTPSNPTIPSIPIESLDPPWENVGTNLSIESADMLNYYSAIYLLAQQNTVNFTSAGSNSGYGLTLLDTLDTTEPPYGDIPIYSTPSSTMPPNVDYDDPEPPPPPPWEYDPDNTEPPGGNTEGPPVNPPTEPTQRPDEFYYYDIDPNAAFHLSKVIFFRIYLSGEGYLTQQIGSGVVDVVITDFDIFGDYLVTFKNGDKYYSCLTDGKSRTEYRFTAHKYIEGFQVVKNLALQDHRFNVQFDENGQSIYFACGYFEEGECPVLGQTYIANVSEDLTLGELESYFRSFKAPTQSE